MMLLIAEKPSDAKQIAQVVGAYEREKGYYYGDKYIVTWCVGHLVELAQPQAYSLDLAKWTIDTLPIIPDNYKTTVMPETAEQYNVIKTLSNKDEITEIIAATDAGREGELIFRLVYDKVGCKKPVKRLWLNSMEPDAITSGLKNMKSSSEYDNLYQSALCRQRADWLVGINYTRLYSKIHNTKLRIGRVQTPTLKMIIDRDKEIEHFVPTTYYNVVAEFCGFKAYTTAKTEKAAQDIQSRCAGRESVVVSVETKKVTDTAPPLYDITTLQCDANVMLGYTAQQTLDIVQHLYEKRLVTYPRTNSKYITEDMHDTTLAVIDIASKFLNLQLDAAAKVDNIINNKKVSDHHAIIPTVSYSPEAIAELPTSEKNIYMMIAMRLLIAISPPRIYNRTNAVIDVDGELFAAAGNETLEPGYRAISDNLRVRLGITNNDEDNDTDTDEKNKDNATLPPMSEGNSYTVRGVNYKATQTCPPKRYNDATLLFAMENAGRRIDDIELRDAIATSGIGTPATRANIIESLISGGYVTREKKVLISTQVAREYIPQIDTTLTRLTSVELTAEWEKQLEDIRLGNQTPDTFMASIEGELREVVTVYKDLISRGVIEITDTPVKKSRNVIGKCPKCGKDVVEYKNCYSCVGGKECGFTVWKEIAGKSISATQATKLCETGHTDKLEGFTGKKGKYNARLKLNRDNGIIGFDFT